VSFGGCVRLLERRLVRYDQPLDMDTENEFHSDGRLLLCVEEAGASATEE